MRDVAGVLLVAQHEVALGKAGDRGLYVGDALDLDRAGGAALQRDRRDAVDVRVVPIQTRRLVLGDVQRNR